MNRHRQRRRTSAVRRSRAGGALYSMVVINALLVGMLGLSALTVARIERRQQATSSDLLKARRHAAAAVELAALELRNNPNWRRKYTHAAETAPVNFGSGEAGWRVLDLVDANLGNSAEDAVMIQGIGRVGEAVWVETVEALPAGGSAETLTKSLHAHGRITVGNLGHFIAGGAPLSTSGELRIHGTVFGHAECFNTTGAGNVTGSLTDEHPPKGLPAAHVFDLYKGTATTLAYGGSIEGKLIAPGLNTYGGQTHPEGLYFIHTGGNLLVIRGSRIHGTLVVDGNVRIDDAALLHNSRTDYPTLIVRGNLTLNLSSSSNQLQESTWATNFNPSAAPYNGNSNSHQSDAFPNELRGLVHVIGNLTLASTSRVTGVVICEGEVDIPGQARVQHDPLLVEIPPLGYESAADHRLKLLRHTWRRAAAP